MYSHKLYYYKFNEKMLVYIPSLGNIYILDNKQASDLPSFILSKDKELFKRGEGKEN